MRKGYSKRTGIISKGPDDRSLCRSGGNGNIRPGQIMEGTGSRDREVHTKMILKTFDQGETNSELQ